MGHTFHETGNLNAGYHSVVGDSDHVPGILAHARYLALGEHLDLLLSIAAPVDCNPGVTARAGGSMLQVAGSLSTTIEQVPI